MKWRVMLEFVGPDGTVGVHEVGGRAAVAEYAPQMIGLTLEEGKHLLAALQVHLVQAQAEDHSRRRRRCQRCGALRPVKDQRSRQLVSLFGTVEVRVPRFTPCRCAVTCRRTLNPVAEIMPDRCTPEYERTVAKMVRCCPTVGHGRCWRSFCRSASHRPWKPPGSEPSVLAPGWSKRLSRGRDPSRRWQRNLSRSPLTAATCGQLASLGVARGSPRSGQQR